MSVFPLSAVVGQEALVEALLVNAVDPGVGGVLVRGERGTAKSTAVRGLAALLPPVMAARAEAFCFMPGDRTPGTFVPGTFVPGTKVPGTEVPGTAVPGTGVPGTLVPPGAAVEERAPALVELPLGATLDRLVGSLDLGRALAGEHAFEPGLLARAHRGVLYVDEVNLLPDHLVDAVLDAAASGVARVEREAVSVEHDARFLLVGTMNAEEGELRPQLLDRFGLGVEVTTPTDTGVRAEIVRRRLAFEADPAAFVARFAADEAALAARIADARARLPRVRLPGRELQRIVGACVKLGVDGVRGDIVSARCAQVLAALDGVEEVAPEHVRRACALALAHRRRRDPLDAGGGGAAEELDRALDDDGGGDDDGPDGSPPSGGGGGGGGVPDEHPAGREERQAPPAPATGQGLARERRDPAAPARLPADALRLEGTGRGPAGRRARTVSPSAGAIDSRPAATHDDLAVVASLRARMLGEAGLREHVRAGREGALLCLVVDASGSMGARRRLARVKGALLGALRDAYARRDRVAVVAFRDGDAHELVAPGAPIEQAAHALRELPTGGRTPLAAGLRRAERVILRERVRDPRRRAVAVVLTDGRVADPDGAVRAAARALGRTADAVHVVDIEEGRVRLGLAAELAHAAGAGLHSLITERRAA